MTSRLIQHLAPAVVLYIFSHFTIIYIHSIPISPHYTDLYVHYLGQLHWCPLYTTSQSVYNVTHIKGTSLNIKTNESTSSSVIGWSVGKHGINTITWPHPLLVSCDGDVGVPLGVPLTGVVSLTTTGLLSVSCCPGNKDGASVDRGHASNSWITWCSGRDWTRYFSSDRNKNRQLWVCQVNKLLWWILHHVIS